MRFELNALRNLQPKSKIKAFLGVCVIPYFANLPIMRQYPLFYDVSSNRVLHKTKYLSSSRVDLITHLTERTSLLIDPEELPNMPAYQLHDFRLSLRFSVAQIYPCGNGQT